MNNANLLVHLELDKLGDAVVFDSSDSKNHARIFGTPKLVNDPTFGACLEFAAGDGLTSEQSIDLGEQYTLEAWIHSPSPLIGTVELLQVGLDPSSRTWLWDASENSTGALFLAGASLQGSLPLVQPGRWTHIAMTRTAGELHWYLNGSRVNTQPDPSPGAIVPGPLAVAGGARPDTGFVGRMAHIRVYSKALTAEEVKEDFATDQSSAVSFLASHPIEFSIENDDGQSTLYIVEDPTKQDLRVMMRNESGGSITLDTPPEGAHPDQASHHVRMRFRPGVIPDGVIEVTKLAPELVTEGWQMSMSREPDGGLSVFLLATQGVVLHPAHAKELRLIGFGPDARGGARGTRIQFEYRRMSRAGQSGELTGRRISHVNLVNHRGQPNAPIHLAAVGSNTILNDGSTPNALALHLTNTSTPNPSHPDRAELVFAGTGNATESRLIVSVDARTADQALGNKREWALCETDQAALIEVEIPGWTLEEESTTGISPEWIFTTESTRRLQAGESMEIRMSNLVSNAPTGGARLYIRHENVPGYWDATTVGLIAKTPLLSRDVEIRSDLRDRQVGVGLDPADPAIPEWERAKLTVEGTWETQFQVTRPGQPTGLQVHAGTQATSIHFLRYGTKHAGIVFDGQRLMVKGMSGRKDHHADTTVAVSIDEAEAVDMQVAGKLEARTVEGVGAAVRGMIVMWHGDINSPPTGWAVCNGTQGTPDLRDRFVVGAGARYNSNQTGGQGSVTLTAKQMPSHSHVAVAHANGSHTHQMYFDTGGGGFAGQSHMAKTSHHMQTNVLANYKAPTRSAGNHNHSVVIHNAGGKEAHENRPPFHALVFIMKL